MDVSYSRIKDDVFVIASDRTFEFKIIKSEKMSLTDNINKDNQHQIFNIFCGYYQWHFLNNANKVIESRINKEYLEALVNNFITLSSVEKALVKAIEFYESNPQLMNRLILSYLKSTFLEEYGHIKLVEHDLKSNLQHDFDENVLQKSTLFSQTIDELCSNPNPYKLLAIGFVLEFNSLHVDKNNLANALDNVTGESKFFDIHSFGDVEISHFSKNILLLQQLEIDEIRKVFSNIGPVIDVMHDSILS